MSQTSSIHHATPGLPLKITTSNFLKSGRDWFGPDWAGFGTDAPLSPSIETSSDFSSNDVHLDVINLDELADDGTSVITLVSHVTNLFHRLST